MISTHRLDGRVSIFIIASAPLLIDFDLLWVATSRCNSAGKLKINTSEQRKNRGLLVRGDSIQDPY